LTFLSTKNFNVKLNQLCDNSKSPNMPHTNDNDDNSALSPNKTFKTVNIEDNNLVTDNSDIINNYHPLNDKNDEDSENI